MTIISNIDGINMVDRGVKRSGLLSVGKVCVCTVMPVAIQLFNKIVNDACCQAEWDLEARKRHNGMCYDRCSVCPVS